MQFLRGLFRKQEKENLDEIQHQEFHRRKKITKFENELKSIKQAYESKFISEETYLRAKKRIEDNLRILRKIDVQVLQVEGFIKQS